MLAHQSPQGVREEDRLDDLQGDLVVEEDGDEDEVDGDADIPGAGVAELEGDSDLPNHDEGRDRHAVHKIPGEGAQLNISVLLFQVAARISLVPNNR